MGVFVCLGDGFARGSVIVRAREETSSIYITRRSRIGAISRLVRRRARRTSERARRATRGDGRLLFRGGEQVQGGGHGRGHRLRGRLALEPPADPGPGVGCAEGARWFGGCAGVTGGTDEGGPMGAGVICAIVSCG